MSKSSRKLYSNIYEGDIMDLDIIEELEKVEPILSNKAIRKAARQSSGTIGKQQNISILKNSVTINPVDATCNKCSGKIVGELLSDIYVPNLNKLVPFISYSCKHCGHSGKRSVLTLALPPDAYDRKYFN